MATRAVVSAGRSFRRVRAGATRRRTVVVLGVLLAVIAIALVTLAMGDYPIPVPDVVRTLTGGGTRIEDYIVFQVRAPRLTMGMLAGACLGTAGALLQGLLRNPLASPDLLGISGGSGLAAVFALLILGVTGPVLAGAAFLGGILAAAVLLIAGGRSESGGYRLILAGVGLSFLTLSVTSYLMVRAKLQLAQEALIWLTGSLSATPWWAVLTVGGVALVALPAVIACARWLPLLQLGSATAMSLGVRPSAVRVLGIAAAVLLTAVTCAFAGPISFIALCAPAIARPLLGHGALGIGTSAAFGAALLTAADLVAQFAIPGHSVPVGVVTGALGAVFLLWLLATSKGRQL